MPGKGIGFNPLKNKILDTKKAFSESVDVTDIKNFVGSDSLKNLDLSKTELLTNDLASTMINTKPMNFKHSAHSEGAG